MAGHSHGTMDQRGVTRPMAEHDAGAHDKGGEHHGPDGQGSDGHGGHQAMPMSREDRLAMLRQHHARTLWVYWTIVLLGVWLLLSPATLGYGERTNWDASSGGRGVWFSDQTLPALRASLMSWSDVVTGLVVLVFGWRSLTPNRPISLWICCGAGMWLTFAPVLFWAPTAAAYLNDTIVGMLLMALTVLIPGMPNMILFMQHGPSQPPGWTYNPSSWPQRWIMIVTGFAGLVVSRYLAMFQLGYIDYVWDPFFGFKEGTERVLNSQMSHMWPVSDAGFGAIAYTFEFLMGYMGSPSRWRTMPWMVAFFGILVIPLGLVHIALVISQPLVVHAWCSMCLLAALVMLPMIPLEVDEVVAMGQHLATAKRRGDRGGSLWKIFWLGGSAEGCTSDERSPELLNLPQRPWKVFLSSIWGMSFPWTLMTTTGFGLVAMACPTWFGLSIESAAADVGHLGGALIVTVSVVSMGEVLRAGRLLNVVVALGIASFAWFVGTGVEYAATLSVVGAAVALLSLPRGTVRERYGNWRSP